jgi:EmrB/QacA subfamily drug resistance transporter
MTSHSTQNNWFYANRWFALAVLCAAQFMVIMDTSIIGVALPAIQTSLDYSDSGLQWIFNAYVIFFGGFLLLGGKLSDVMGARKTFITGFSILTLSSLFAGFAWNEFSMNAGRAIQGFGAALIAPSSLTILMRIFTDPGELGKAFGFYGASAAAGGSAGVFLGGILTEYLSWNWTFFVNVPIGIVVIIAAFRYLQQGPSVKSKIDYTGTILITGSIMSMVYALVTVDRHGWGSLTTISLLSFSVILLITFLLVQSRSNSPLIPLKIFAAKNLSAGNTVMALLAGAWIPLWFFLNLYLQRILEYTPFYSGLALLPMTIAIMIMMTSFTGRLIGKIGMKPTLLTGLAALTVSLFWFAQVPLEGNFLQDVLGPSLLGALGMSLAYIPATMVSMSGVKPEESGLASGIVNTTYQLGSAIGLAVVVAISTAFTQVSDAINTMSHAAIHTGYQTAFIAAGTIALLGLAAGFLIKK